MNKKAQNRHLSFFGWLAAFALTACACSGNIRSYDPDKLGSDAPDQTVPSTGSAPNGAKLNLQLAIGGPYLVSPPASESLFPDASKSCKNSLSSQGASPSLVPNAYVRACAGCHAADGSGNKDYPSLLTQQDFNVFLHVIRAGVATGAHEMPAFDSAHLDDDDARRIFAWVSKTGLVESFVCTDKAEKSSVDIEQAYARGLTAFRKTSTSRDGRSCMQCHAADGLTFAYLGFSEGDILRRADTHLVGADAMAIVDMVTALRAKHHLPRRDPLLSRPFQPGSVPLEGGNTAERDTAFGTQLANYNLILAKRPINTSDDALLAEAQLMSLDLHVLRIPLIFNLFSEDGYHNPSNYIPDCTSDIDGCEDHGSVAEWVPVAAHTFSNPQNYLAAQDNYLSKFPPTNADLRRLIASLPGMDALEGVYPSTNNRYLDDLKWRSSFVLDYCIRQEIAGANPNCYQLTSRPAMAGVEPFMWNIGSYAKRLAEGSSGFTQQIPCDTQYVGCSPEQTPMLYNNLTPGAKLSDNMQRLGNPWFALQWQHFDPALMSTGDNTAQLSEYFTRALFWANNDGDNGGKAINPAYSNYAAFHVVMHNVALINEPQSYDCNSKMPFFHPDLGAFPCTAVDIRSGYYPELTSFSEGKSLYNTSNWSLSWVPKDQPRRAQYQLIAGNMYRLFLRKLIGALKKNNWMCRQDIQKLRIERAKSFLNQTEIVAENGPSDQEMFSTLETLMAKSQVSCPPYVK